MAKVEFNVNWWKKHGAKTLTDTGMSEALRDWEATKKDNAGHTIKALTALHKAAAAAEKKANKTLHKETIGFLKAYQDMCVDFVGKLKTADGSRMASFDKIMTKPMLAVIGDHREGKLFINELLYLFVTKANPKAASDGIYKMFIKAGSPKQVNLDSDERDVCDQLAAAGTWVDDGWEKARTFIDKLTLTSAVLKNIQENVLARIEAEPVLVQIRAA